MSLLDGYWYKIKAEFPGGTRYYASRNYQDASGNWSAAIISVSPVVRAIDEEKLYQPQSVEVTLAVDADGPNSLRDMMAHATNGIIDRSQVTIYTIDAAGSTESTRKTRVESYYAAQPNTLTLVCTDWNCGIDLKFPADFITEKEYPNAADDAIGEAVQQVWGRHAASLGALRAWKVNTNVYLAGAGELYSIDAIFDASGTQITNEENWSYQYDSTDERTYIYYASSDDYLTFNCYGRVDASSAYVSDPVDILEEIITAFGDEFTDFTLSKNAASFTTVGTTTSGRSYECSICLDQPQSFRDIIETWAACFDADWIINDSEELELSIIDPTSYSSARTFTDADILQILSEEAHPENIVNKVQFFYNFDYVLRQFQDTPTYSKAQSITDHGEKFREVRLLMIQDDDTALDVMQRYVSRRYNTPRYLQFTVRPAAWLDGCSVGDIITVNHVDLIKSGNQEYQVLRAEASDLQEVVTIAAISFDMSTDCIINSWAETGGSISPSGFTDVTYNGNQNYVATPDSGYSFNEFVVDGTAYGDGDAGVTNNGDGTFDYDFTNVTANHTIYVTFTLDWAGHEVTATANAYGRITPSSTTGPLYYDTNADPEFILTPKNATYPPNLGASLLDLKVKETGTTSWTTYTPGVDPELVDEGNGRYSYEITNIATDWTLFARFTI